MIRQVSPAQVHCTIANFGPGTLAAERQQFAACSRPTRVRHDTGFSSFGGASALPKKAGYSMLNGSVSLEGLGVLVVEDEPLIALDLTDELVARGAKVIGPAATVDGALSLVDAHAVDGAILDVRLRTELVFPVADALLARKVPFIFATAYQREHLQDYTHIEAYHKPAPAVDIVHLLAGVMGRRSD
jgi:CheY-like chemotaxis protein